MALDRLTRNLTLNATLRVNFSRCLEVEALHGGIVNVVRNLVKLVLRPRCVESLTRSHSLDDASSMKVKYVASSLS
jgi:hypothetical protein